MGLNDRPEVRLLYIDDDPAFIRLAQRQLARRGYRTDVCMSGEDGLAQVQSGGVDVVALDHYMPGQDGLSTLIRIRELPDPPPVVYVTGTQEGSVAVAALKAGAADYVVKDIHGDFYALLDVAIRSAIESAALRREKAAADRAVKEARDRFETLAAERQVLLREVNHRVGNSLQLVAAFLHLQASSASEETRSALAEANRRVLAIAQVHRRLYASDDVTAISLDHYLAGLIDDIRQSSDADGGATHLSLQADATEVDPDTAVTIGIIVTELVINAIKYAYPHGQGPIRVVLVRQSETECLLAVEDDGIGKSATIAPSRSGLGRSIISAMAAKLCASVDYAATSHGTRASLVFRHVAATTA